MNAYKIAVVPGDGIGPEVCQAAQRVLDGAVMGKVRLEYEEVPAGAGYFLKTGEALPDSSVETCKGADAVILGAAGLPGVLLPDGTEAGQDTTLKLRFLLDLYANIRPIRLYDGVSSPLRGQAKIDYVIVRENTEGLYASRGKGVIEEDQVSDTMVISRQGVERIVRTAAEICMQRNGAPGDGKKRVTICDKSNVLRSFAFFRKVADNVLDEYPEIEVDYALVDALSMYLVTRPEYYDVVVTENMFGDILSDLGAATIGGLGMASSAEIGTDHGLFQASHGSAPDIAGKGLANPLATILSGASMLEWLGRKKSDTNLLDSAGKLRHAVESVLKEGKALTGDLGGSSSTEACMEAVCELL